MFAVSLVCCGCESSYSPDDKVVVCEKCGDVLDVRYDLKEVKRNIDKASLKSRVHSLWRYRELLPIKDEHCIVSLGEGMTPVVRVPRYGALLKLSKLSMKLDYNNPTGSFKDRGSTVSVSKLKELGINEIIEDSSGNAGASLAAYSAPAGIKCRLYVPADAPNEKLLQARFYGADITSVPGTRTAVTKAAENAWRTTGVYYASHNISAFFLEGMKTLAYEIAEDSDWDIPDHVVLPVGGGTLFVGAWKGFMELFELGWIKRLPRFHCVQSTACMPIVKAFHEGTQDVSPVEELETIAGGIRITNPERGKQVLQVLNESKGSAVGVADQEIIQQQRVLARKEGIFAEPTSCATLAGLEHLVNAGTIGADEAVLVSITGFGLKDSKNAAKAFDSASQDT